MKFAAVCASVELFSFVFVYGLWIIRPWSEYRNYCSIGLDDAEIADWMWGMGDRICRLGDDVWVVGDGVDRMKY